MLDNYLFLSVRAGESPGQPSATADSDTNLFHENWRSYHIDAPHWLPPAEVADLFTVSEWKLIIEFTSDEGVAYYPSLDGVYEYTFKAGKGTYISEYDGVVTTSTSEGPGWESVIDGISGKRYFDDELEEYVDGQMGFFSVSKAVLVPNEPNELGIVSYTVEELHVACSVVGASPAFYVEAGELEPVWVFAISFLGEIRSYGEFEIPPQNYDFETRLGTYDRGAGEEHEIGFFNTLSPESNNIIKMTLSASAFHEDFETIPAP